MIKWWPEGHLIDSSRCSLNRGLVYRGQHFKHNGGSIIVFFHLDGNQSHTVTWPTPLPDFPERSHISRLLAKSDLVARIHPTSVGHHIIVNPTTVLIYSVVINVCHEEVLKDKDIIMITQ